MGMFVLQTLAGPATQRHVKFHSDSPTNIRGSNSSKGSFLSADSAECPPELALALARKLRNSVSHDKYQLAVDMSRVRRAARPPHFKTPWRNRYVQEVGNLEAHQCYIGRGNSKLEASPWGNPCKVAELDVDEAT